MRKSLVAASLASLLVAAPAFAQDAASPFTGPRIGLTAGIAADDLLGIDTGTISVEAGYDIDLGSAVVGAGAEYQTNLGSQFLDVNETALLARAGAKLGTNALVYASGGYTRISDGATPFDGDGVDGYRVGGGVEFVASNGALLKIEQRYLDYGSGAHAFQTVAGVGFRF